MKRVIFILIAMIASMTAMAQETANERLIAATNDFNAAKEKVIEISKIDKRYERCYVVQEELRDFYFESLKDTPNYPEKTLDEIMELWRLSLNFYTRCYDSFPLEYQYRLVVETLRLIAEQKTRNMKIIKNSRFKDIDSVEVKDNQAVYDKAKKVLTTVIDNLDFINFKNSNSIDRASSELRYTNVAYTDEQLSSLSDYLFSAPFVVKVDDVEYYAMVIQIVTVENGINFRFIVFK